MEPVGVSMALHHSSPSSRPVWSSTRPPSANVGYARTMKCLPPKTVLSVSGSRFEGDAVGLRALDPRLAEQRIVEAASNILSCMRRLFEDSGALIRRYGLQPMSDDLVRDGSAWLQQNTSLVKAAHWAMTNKKQFQRFVEDLRDFNDGLFLLFPDVDVHARGATAAEIQHSADLAGFQIVEKAVSDLKGGGAELADAASSRITQISHYTASAGWTTGSDGEDDDEDDISKSRRVELRGSLTFSYFGIRQGESYAYLGFYGMNVDDFMVQRHQEREHVKQSYPAWSLMYISHQKRHDQDDFSKLDTEVREDPGPRNIDGYIAEFHAWLKSNSSPTARFLSDTEELPNRSFQSLVERVRTAQVDGGWAINKEAADRDLSSLIGRGGLDFNERASTFPNVLGSASLSEIAVATSDSLYLFLFQVLLAHELWKRMAQRERDVAFGNVSPRVVAAMQASERWLAGVQLEIPDAKGKPDLFHSLVHDRQVEGLVRFAEVMTWPALREMRTFAEEAYAGLRAGRHTISYHLWDWLFGLMLPGNAFVFTIMTALVAATPSLRHLGAARYCSSGLVVGDRSYWRVKTVLGRVLGEMKGVREVNGWVGPCPRPAAVGVVGQRIRHARQVAFPRFMPREQPTDGGRFARFYRKNEDESPSAEWNPRLLRHGYKLYSKSDSLACYYWLVGLEDDPAQSKFQATLHPAFASQFVPESISAIADPILELEFDADRKYGGWSPGSTSVTGFTRDVTLWKIVAKAESSDKPPPVWVHTQSKSLQSDFIDQRWGGILEGLGDDFTDRRALRGFGNSFAWLDPNEGFRLRHQITDLLGAMSSSPVPNLNISRSISLLAFNDRIDPTPSFGFVDFMRQMLLAREAIHSTRQPTLKMQFKPADGYSISPTMMRQQLYGIIMFVYQMRWPFAVEVHKEAALICDCLDGNRDPNFDVSFTDWAAGLALPGATFPLTVLSAVCSLSPTLRTQVPSQIVQARQGNYGIVHPQASYHRHQDRSGTALDKQQHRMDTHTPPDQSPDTDAVTLQTIRLSKAQAAGALNNAKDATPCTVRLDFLLHRPRTFTTFTLCTNSVFIAVLPCRGTHRVDPD
ncbi:hypothetical protein BDW75DRAFT_243010 [Aspergillus navahoensis]